MMTVRFFGDLHPDHVLLPATNVCGVCGGPVPDLGALTRPATVFLVTERTVGQACSKPTETLSKAALNPSASRPQNAPAPF
jgi:hypothetical protein